MAGPSNPYATLGVDPAASEVELRAAYRRAVQRHHPDHNHGSAESARRFEEVQEAYAEIRRQRATGDGPAPRRSAPGPAPSTPPPDPDLEARLAAMERELKQAHDARERAVRAARAAAEQARRDARTASPAPGGRERPTDEELGYYSTDDSFSKILDDAAAELSDRWSDARRSPAAHRVSDLIDDLAAKLTGESHKRGE